MIPVVKTTYELARRKERRMEDINKGKTEKEREMNNYRKKEGKRKYEDDCCLHHQSDASPSYSSWRKPDISPDRQITLTSSAFANMYAPRLGCAEQFENRVTYITAWANRVLRTQTQVKPSWPHVGCFHISNMHKAQNRLTTNTAT